MRTAPLATALPIALSIGFASCSNSSAPTGVEIVVAYDPASPIDHVRLFLAHPHPQMDKGLSIAHGASRRTWIYDQLDHHIDAIATADLATPGSAVFVLEEGTDGLGDDVPYAIAVGLASGSAVAVGSRAGLTMIPGEVRQYTIELGAASDLEAPAKTSARGVELWGPDGASTAAGDDQQCVRVTAGSGDPTADDSAIVFDLAGDPDCDGGNECFGDDYVFDGATHGSDDTCAGDVLPGSVGGCALGAATCVDGSGAGCGPNRDSSVGHCSFDSLCEACPYSPFQTVAQCVGSDAFAELTHLECDFPASADGSGGYMLCAQVLGWGSDAAELFDGNSQPYVRLPDESVVTTVEVDTRQLSLDPGELQLNGPPHGAPVGELFRGLVILPPARTNVRGAAIPIVATVVGSDGACGAGLHVCSLVMGSDVPPGDRTSIDACVTAP